MSPLSSGTNKSSFKAQMIEVKNESRFKSNLRPEKVSRTLLKSRYNRSGAT